MPFARHSVATLADGLVPGTKRKGEGLNGGINESKILHALLIIGLSKKSYHS